MVKAVFAGSFDPITNGHLDIIQRAAKLFGSLDVVISENPEKKYMFTEDERRKMVEELTSDLDNVTVHVYTGLVVNYAQKIGANVLIRGVRSTNDFAYEFDLALMNRKLNPEIETVFLQSKEKNVVIKSSSIKELAMFDGDISRMVPPLVEKAVKAKFGKLK